MVSWGSNTSHLAEDLTDQYKTGHNRTPFVGRYTQTCCNMTPSEQNMTQKRTQKRTPNGALGEDGTGQHRISFCAVALGHMEVFGRCFGGVQKEVQSGGHVWRGPGIGHIWRCLGISIWRPLVRLDPEIGWWHILWMPIPRGFHATSISNTPSRGLVTRYTTS